MIHFHRVLAVFCLLLYLLSCSEDCLTGNGSQTGNPMVSGYVYEADGKTPAVNATIIIRRYRSSFSPVYIPEEVPTDSVVTRADDKGYYAIDSLDVGTYFIECFSDGNLVALSDTVRIDSRNTVVEMPATTLKPAAGMIGKVTFDGIDSIVESYVVIMGTYCHTKTEGGSFNFSYLAEGTYTIRIISPVEGYGIFDVHDITVVSGKITNMGTVVVPFLDLSENTTLSIRSDSLLHIMHISWEHEDTTGITGVYLCRRDLTDSTMYVREKTGLLTGNEYYDTLNYCGRSYCCYLEVARYDGSENYRTEMKTVPVSRGMVLKNEYQVDGDWHGGYRNVQHKMARSPRGDFYIIMQDSNEIAIFDENFNMTGSLEDTGSHLQASISISSKGGTVFVSDVTDLATWYINSIGIYTSEGILTKRLYTRSSTRGAGIRAMDIDACLFTVDSNNRIIFVSSRQDSIYIVDTSGAVVNKWEEFSGFPDELGPYNYGRVASVTTDNQNNIYVNNYKEELKIYDPQGALVHTIDYNQGGLLIGESGYYPLPVFDEDLSVTILLSVAKDPETGYLYCLTNHLLLVFDRNYNLIFRNCLQDDIYYSSNLFIGEETLLYSFFGGSRNSDHKVYCLEKLF